jgi:MFS transporter, FHS family, L-fucose permease
MAITNAKSTAPVTVPVSASTTNPLAMVMVLYFSWGSITSLNDMLIPRLKSIFTLNYAEAMLVQFPVLFGQAS